MQHIYRLRFHLIAALSILLGCLAPQASWAVPLKPGDGIDAPVSLGGHLAVLHDPTGALTIDDVASERTDRQFQPIPSMLTEGYRKGATWVRFTLSAPAAPSKWLLQVERPLIEHVTLFVPDGAGEFVASPPGNLSGDRHTARAYPTLFPISVSSAENVYYLRLQSMTSITTALNVWQKGGYERYRHSDNWIMGIEIGAIGAMILANLLYAYLLRGSLYLLYAAVLFESALMTIFHLGYADEFLYPLSPEKIHRSWGVIVCLYSIVTVWFMGRLFEFHRHKTWAWRIVQGVLILNGGALVFAAAGHYGDVGLFVSRLQQISYLFITVFVLYLLILRRQHQYLLSALAFAVLIAVSLAMQSQYVGINLFELNSSLARFMAIGILVHLVLLSAAVAQRARLAELSLTEEKDRVLALSRAAEHELAIKVRERTEELVESNASLREEMKRRQLLEVKLRQSLDSVNEALAQQRSFVALVSHEFRGPLAVIAAAAENLALSAADGVGNIKARTTKIRQTVRRMSMLLENVLAGDRLDADQVPPSKITSFDLNEVLRTTKAGLDDDATERVSFVHAGEVTVMGDRNLLEIVVQNLIQNALKYSAATESVTVRLWADRHFAFIDVVDQGIGVAVDDRELIFKRYYRAAGQRANGSGLGLYIAREIARQHGGDLILAASDVNGSTFRLSLPIANPQLGDFSSSRPVS